MIDKLKAVLYTQNNGRITNKEYQELNRVSDRTALRDIDKLLEQKILKRIGFNKGSYYELVN
jgi:ATP-dependent DNA helicase RecG